MAVSCTGCAGKITRRRLERRNASQEESYPRTLYRQWCGVVVPDLCMNVCVIDEVYSPNSAAHSVASAQPCSASRPVGIALFMCLPSASWIISL